MIKFDKDLVTFDLETTGLNKSKDFIIQFAAIKIDKDTLKIKDKLNLYIRPTGSYSISIAAYFKHGIKPEFLEDKPTLKEVAPQIIEFFGDCDVLTYNGKRFDIPFLIIEMQRNGFVIDFLNRKCYDSFMIEQKKNGNKLTQTFVRYYGKTMDEMGLKAHDAISDVKATFGVFKAQMKSGDVEPEDMFGEDGVIDYMEFRDEMVPCFTLGKYRQISVKFVAEIDQQYLNWCVSDKCEFVESTKNYIRKFIKE